MPTTVDYDQFLHRHRNPGLQPDLHWTFLPSSEIAKQAAANPPQHKILLLPADPDNSPTEDKLWPVVHPPSSIAVVAAVNKVIDDH